MYVFIWVMQSAPFIKNSDFLYIKEVFFVYMKLLL